MLLPSFYELVARKGEVTSMRYLKIILVTFALMAAGAPVNAQNPGPSNNGDDLDASQDDSRQAL